MRSLAQRSTATVSSSLGGKGGWPGRTGKYGRRYFHGSKSCSAMELRNTQGEDLFPPYPVEKIEWSKLGFDYIPTNSIIQYHYKDGKWDEGSLTGPMLHIHAMSNVLHYGQAVFEGLKAFHNKQGKVHLFNSGENYKRLSTGTERLGMPKLPEQVFDDALNRVIEANLDYVPPYGSGGSLYIRPFLFGHGAKLGLGKAPQYTFGVLVSPVGSYYKTGIQAVDAYVIEEYDRAAPHGVGNIKCAGNYAADVKPSSEAAAKGFPISLYLDAREHAYVEEFSTSNFAAISADGSTYVTPKSESILPSITNIMLRQLASDRGLKVEERPIPWSEVPSFSQVAACGTAVIVTPIKSITRNSTNEKVQFPSFETFSQLYQDVRDVQTGDQPDTHGWCRVVCDKPHQQ